MHGTKMFIYISGKKTAGIILTAIATIITHFRKWYVKNALMLNT